MKCKLSKKPKAHELLWVTKEGKMIRIHEMDDKHLLNSIRLLERRAAEFKLTMGIALTTAEIIKEAMPIHKFMVEEMEKRLKAAEDNMPLLVGGRQFDFTE